MKYWMIHTLAAIVHGAGFNEAKARAQAEQVAKQNPGTTYVVSRALECCQSDVFGNVTWTNGFGP